jgi:hypothetical protein
MKTPNIPAIRESANEPRRRRTVATPPQPGVGEGRITPPIPTPATHRQEMSDMLVRFCASTSHLRPRLDLLPGGHEVREGTGRKAKPHCVPQSMAESRRRALDRNPAPRVARLRRRSWPPTSRPACRILPPQFSQGPLPREPAARHAGQEADDATAISASEGRAIAPRRRAASPLRVARSRSRR